MSTTLPKSYGEAMLELVDEYLRVTGKQEYRTEDLAVWAIRTKKWEPPPDLVLRKCKEDFANALRDDIIQSSRGPVRAKHVDRRYVAGEQQYFWGDIRDKKRKYMFGGLKMRRDQVAGECKQMDRDASYWNAINPNEEPIQLNFDFTEDVEEGRYSPEYPPKNPR